MGASDDEQGETGGSPPKSRPGDSPYGRSHRNTGQEIRGDERHFPRNVLSGVTGAPFSKSTPCSPFRRSSFLAVRFCSQGRKSFATLPRSSSVLYRQIPRYARPVPGLRSDRSRLAGSRSCFRSARPSPSSDRSGVSYLRIILITSQPKELLGLFPGGPALLAVFPRHYSAAEHRAQQLGYGVEPL